MTCITLRARGYDRAVTLPARGPVADSVRLAWPTEADEIAGLQRRSWAALPDPLGQTLLGGISLTQMSQIWHQVIIAPPRAQFRVLVAVHPGGMAGFATTVPSEDVDTDPARDGEIDQFVIDPPARQLGHGSRLLNACADTLRSDGFLRARWWVPAADDGLLSFLTAAGWAPDGAHREIGTEDESVRLEQVRLHTDLADPG